MESGGWLSVSGVVRVREWSQWWCHHRLSLGTHQPHMDNTQSRLHPTPVEEHLSGNQGKVYWEFSSWGQSWKNSMHILGLNTEDRVRYLQTYRNWPLTEVSQRQRGQHPPPAPQTGRLASRGAMATPDINQTLIINNMLTPHVYGDSLFFYVYIQLSTICILIILLTMTLT